MTQAQRHNEGKPHLSYLLTFGVPAECWIDDDLDICAFVDALGEWYRGEKPDLADTLDAFCEIQNEDLSAFARLCEFGERKYGRGNYLLGRPWSDTCDSLLRHLAAYCRGEDRDPESGLDHMVHVQWNMYYLYFCVECQIGKDDRANVICEIKERSEALSPPARAALDCPECETPAIPASSVIGGRPAWTEGDDEVWCPGCGCLLHIFLTGDCRSEWCEARVSEHSGRDWRRAIEGALGMDEAPDDHAPDDLAKVICEIKERSEAREG